MSLRCCDASLDDKDSLFVVFCSAGSTGRVSHYYGSSECNTTEEYTLEPSLLAVRVLVLLLYLWYLFGCWDLPRQESMCGVYT